MACGRFTSSCRIRTHTSHLVSALLTEYSTLILTSCKSRRFFEEKKGEVTSLEIPSARHFAEIKGLNRSGSVCLDFINQTWSPMFDMINIFEVFLPQLLRYPNPTDPLNGEAAALLIREPKTYEAKVKGSCLICLYCI